MGEFDGIGFARSGVWDSPQTPDRQNAADWDMGTGTRCAAARVVAAVGYWLKQLLEQPYKFAGSANHDGGGHIGRHYALNAGESDYPVRSIGSRLFLGRCPLSPNAGLGTCFRALFYYSVPDVSSQK